MKFTTIFFTAYGKIVVAIEVKSNSEKHTTGLEKFNEMFKPHKSYLVSDEGICFRNTKIN